MKRIMIIGNGGGGKTTLARKLGHATGIPLFHIDSIQFLPGWRVLDKDACDRELDSLTQFDAWIIDGFGSRDAIERRLHVADTIIFVDHAIWTHYWWAIKRQLKSFRGARSELPSGCPEFTVYWTRRLLRVMWKVHTEFRPWFIARIGELPQDKRLIHIRSPREWRLFVAEHCERAVSVK